ncbi:hypothetical protein C8A01DRAFT_44333 [Parachaetomium inaequale]|uniref:Uncharacterized protein n=1 Tax=Parachaetomium inaequale TaxID=2588326 RepID=A0AAN6SUN7_9PEZI|nr:hypothetical protein C8A01DRAFT_44333 [Parachaetomium inaequale]
MGLATAAPAQGSAPIPTLAEPSGPERGTGESKATAQRESAAPSTSTAANGEEKKKRRSLFGFGKKKTEEPAKPAATSKTAPTTTRTKTASPIQTDHAPLSPSSPGRPGFASSPHLASPAGSQIFERDVQESAAALIPTSPAIPSHIQTENYIPPVLDASSEAITDDHLNPDTVEIITHASHRGAATSLSPYTATAAEPSWADELAAFASPAATNTTTAADTASNYGSFDATDVRRLSFISFADVVQAEQAHAPPGSSPSRDSSMYVAGLTSFSAAVNRSPSPIRSPVSSAGGLGSGGSAAGVSPPTSKSGSVKGLEMSMHSSTGRTASPSAGAGRRIPLGSPTSLMSMQLGPGSGGGSGGEIAIETMSQALRRTGSGDLSIGGGGGVRSFPASPI